MEEKKKETLDELFEGTFLEELLEFSGTTGPSQLVGEKEKVIGQMNSLERRLWEMSETYKHMSKEIMALLNNNQVPEEKKASTANRGQALQSTAVATKELMWASIRNRIPISLDIDTVGIREEFKIVMFKNEDKSSSLLKNLKNSGGIVIVIPDLPIEEGNKGPGPTSIN